MPRVKLLAVDLDGTLLNSERVVSQLHANAVQRAVRAGIEIVLASGRNQTAVEHFARELGLNGPLICANGAHVMRRVGVELSHSPLPPLVQNAVIDFAVSTGTHLNLYSRDKLYFLGDGVWAEEYARRVRHVTPILARVEELRSLEATKVMLVGDSAMVEKHRNELGDRLSSQASVVMSEPEYLEFLSIDADKGLGLRQVAEALSIQREETAAIGDYSNDVPMLKWAGVSAVVANASEDARLAARHVFASNDDCGVAGFVDALLLDEEQ